LSIRTMSWFTTETICSKCSSTERELRIMLRQKFGHDFEGCGYIPKLEVE
jgi:hypothetical protein